MAHRIETGPAMQDTLNRSAAKQAPRRFTGAPLSGFGAIDNLPTTYTAELDGRAVLIEDRPEQAHRGLRFRAAWAASPNGIDGFGRTQTGAMDALAENDREEMERRDDLAAHGDSPWYLA